MFLRSDLCRKPIRRNDKHESTEGNWVGIRPPIGVGWGTVVGKRKSGYYARADDRSLPIRTARFSRIEFEKISVLKFSICTKASADWWCRTVHCWGSIKCTGSRNDTPTILFTSLPFSMISTQNLNNRLSRRNNRRMDSSIQLLTQTPLPTFRTQHLRLVFCVGFWLRLVFARFYSLYFGQCFWGYLE